MLNVCQCICLWFPHQERVYSLIVISTYAQCLSMYLLSAVASRKGLQSDCYFHICSMFVNVSVYGSPIKKGFTVRLLLPQMLNVCQCICLWLSYQERLYSLIVINIYAQCVSMYLFMVLPSQKGLQSDCNYHICSKYVNVSVYGSPIKKGFTVRLLLPHMLSVCQCICLWLSHQERVYSLIVITTYAQCLSMYLFMVLPSRKGLQSDCYYHICSMFVSVSVYGSPIKKGLTV